MSGIIRQQIGIAKRQLRQALQEAEAHTSVHDSLFRAYARVNRLWKQREELLKQNPDEEEILKQYITKYGDSRLLLNSAVSLLEQPDQERPLIGTELTKRKLDFEPYSESDADSQRSSDLSAAH
ncbi:unnamed protein product [Nippostrongylus brasiliensis]|uniref:Protein FMC1 homolog n=1 Tax=Nippostrongylus brasiliensis TaxID=27835 RepID=A0A0N4YN45_NIPBR|nr:unnamed protein product [Nippostrongylus brasiliensis]